MRVNEKRMKNMKKPCLIQETISTQKPRQKKRGLDREKREKRYDWMVVSMSSAYMTWQI